MLLGLAGERMVLLNQVHHGVEVAHVFADHEGEMASVDLLIVDNVVADLVASPLSVSRVRQDVLDASEHGDRHSADVLQRDQVSLPLAANNVIVVVCVDLEPVLFQVLGVVEDGLETSAVWLVAHVHCEPVIVIELGVLVHEQLSDDLAELGDVSAEERRDATSEPVGTEQLMDAKQVASISKLCVEERNELENVSLRVRDLRHRAKSDEQGHFVGEVASGVL